MHLVWAPFLCYRINYYLSGGFHPVSFHMVNILLHGGISVLMVDVFSVLFGGLHYTSKGRRLNLAPRSSLLAALLFAVHPVHTECVSIVCSQRLHSWKDEKLGMCQFVSWIRIPLNAPRAVESVRCHALPDIWNDCRCSRFFSWKKWGVPYCQDFIMTVCYDAWWHFLFCLYGYAVKV